MQKRVLLYFFFGVLRFFCSLMAKRWSWTCYDYNQEFCDRLVNLFTTKVLKKLIFQEEKCPDSGRLHLQGFFYLEKKLRFAQVKEILGRTTHIEVSVKDDKYNEGYCSKEDTRTGLFREKHGDFEEAGQGNRTDLGELRELIESGKNVSEINEAEPLFIVRYARGIETSVQLRKNARAPNQHSICVIVLWGPTGIGKSLWARQYCESHGLSFFCKTADKAGDRQWFDLYQGEKVLLLDEFTDEQVGFRELLVWTDVYKLRSHVKGNVVVGEWETVIITSNSDPAGWYARKLSNEDRAPLRRRLDHVFAGEEGKWISDLVSPEQLLTGRSSFVIPERGGQDVGNGRPGDSPRRPRVDEKDEPIEPAEECKYPLLRRCVRCGARECDCFSAHQGDEYWGERAFRYEECEQREEEIDWQSDRSDDGETVYGYEGDDEDCEIIEVE